MIHFSDPESRKLLEERKAQRDNELLLGQVGEATYLRSLMILGYLPDEARTELKLLRMK
jgi:hypothetical protein